MKHGIAKSLAQELLSVVTETLVDAYALIQSVSPQSVRKDDLARDTKYLEDRFAAEGLTFLTVQLPRLGDWFDRFVCGCTMERVVGFAPFDGLFPCFLRPFWIYLERELVQVRGKKRACEGAFSPDIDCVNLAPYRLVQLIRTILHGLKKLEVSPTDEQIKVKLEEFLLIEEDLSIYPIYPSPVIWRAQHLLDEYLAGYLPTCETPRHGPGAVSGGEKLNQKWTWSTLYESLHAKFPYYEHMFGVRSTVFDTGTKRVRSLPLQLAHRVRLYREMRREKEPTARLLFVPKDSRGPRVISCEPKELMYIQQGVARHLMSYIESHAHTKGHVNFIDQSINGRLALEASASRRWATIDLSDASDRVGCELISLLFPKDIVEKWFSLRSTATKLPNGVVLPLRKFAPMGSALCFPVESLTFWAIAVACIWERTSDRDLALQSVYVYGDDIIVKDEHCSAVTDALGDVRLKVNRAKTFSGEYPFRESCGTDGLDGHDVTPFRIRKFPPRQPSDGTAIAAYVKYAENSLYTSKSRSATLLGFVERLVGRIPRTPFPQPFLSLVDPLDFWRLTEYPAFRWNSSLQSYEFRGLVLDARRRYDALDGWFRLQNDLLCRPEGDPSLVVDRSSTQIRRRWCTILYDDVDW